MMIQEGCPPNISSFVYVPWNCPVLVISTRSLGIRQYNLDDVKLNPLNSADCLGTAFEFKAEKSELTPRPLAF